MIDRKLDEELSLKKKFTVTSADTDMFGRLRLSGLVNFLVQSAVYSADKLGFGLKFLRDEKLFWVLSRLEVHIYKTMRWYDEVEVETWPKNIDGLLYLRDFIMRDMSGNVVAKGSSAWIAVDLIRKRPKLIEGFVSEKFYALKEKKALENTPVKLKNVDCTENYELKSTYFDLDVNQHVTTTRYVDWMMDSMSIDFHKENYPKSLIINFIKETKPLESIKVFKKQTKENSFHFEGVNTTIEKTSFRGEIEFNSKLQ